LGCSSILFAPAIAEKPFGAISSGLRKITSCIADPQVEWLALISLLFNLAALLFLKRKSRDGQSFASIGSKTLLGCLACLAVLSHWRTADGFGAPELLVLLSTIVIGKYAFNWVHEDWNPVNQQRRIKLILHAFIALLAIGAFWPTDLPDEFKYGSVKRWAGIWDNPNMYGMLMGAGVVLAAGQLVQCRDMANGRSRSTLWGILLSFATAICGIGLFKSYSRGAWVGTLCGLIYVAVQWFRVLRFQPKANSAQRGLTFWLLRNWRAFAVIVVSLAVIGFWQFRFTEWPPARRVFSSVNINDFSWRNRVVAWEGTIQMMADKPWFGYGWGTAETVYEERFRPPNLESGQAIRMNNYFMLGISAGVPALICLLLYVWLSLKSPSAPIRLRRDRQCAVHNPQLAGTRIILDPALQTLDWSKTICRAGAMVLLVEFWFDGELFKLATGSVFWILLEAGRVGVKPLMDTNRTSIGNHASGAHHPAFSGSHVIGSDTGRASPQISRSLIRIAWILASLAIVETIAFVGTAFLPASKGTLVLARHWLVAPRAVNDLDILATQPFIRDVRIGILVQHSSLANYNRQLINWKLDDGVYRDYVLNPLIDALRDGQLNWRRNLWEYFYLPIRKQTDSAAAAQIVLKYLHKRLTIVAVGPQTIEEMWQQRRADAKGVEALKVAVFRSVGVPARLNEKGKAEIFDFGKWQSVDG